MQVAEGFVLGHEGLKKQIFREYGVNVDAVLRHNKKSQASTVASAAVPSNGADSNAKVLRKRSATISALIFTSSVLICKLSQSFCQSGRSSACGQPQVRPWSQRDHHRFVISDLV